MNKFVKIIVYYLCGVFIVSMTMNFLFIMEALTDYHQNTDQITTKLVTSKIAQSNNSKPITYSSAIAPSSNNNQPITYQDVALLKNQLAQYLKDLHALQPKFGINYLHFFVDVLNCFDCLWQGDWSDFMINFDYILNLKNNLVFYHHKNQLIKYCHQQLNHIETQLKIIDPTDQAKINSLYHNVQNMIDDYHDKVEHLHFLLYENQEIIKPISISKLQTLIISVLKLTNCLINSEEIMNLPLSFIIEHFWSIINAHVSIFQLDESVVTVCNYIQSMLLY